MTLHASRFPDIGKGYGRLASGARLGALECGGEGVGGQDGLVPSCWGATCRGKESGRGEKDATEDGEFLTFSRRGKRRVSTRLDRGWVAQVQLTAEDGLRAREERAESGGDLASDLSSERRMQSESVVTLSFRQAG